MIQDVIVLHYTIRVYYELGIQAIMSNRQSQKKHVPSVLHVVKTHTPWSSSIHTPTRVHVHVCTLTQAHTYKHVSGSLKNSLIH